MQNSKVWELNFYQILIPNLPFAVTYIARVRPKWVVLFVNETFFQFNFFLLKWWYYIERELIKNEPLPLGNQLPTGAQTIWKTRAHRS